LLEGINSILNNSLGMQIVFSAISMLVGQMLVTKSKQVAITMKNHQLEKGINKELVQQRIQEKKNNIEKRKSSIAEKEILISKQKQLITDIKSGKNKEISLATAEADLASYMQQQATEQANLKLDQMELNNLQKDALALGVQNNTVVDNIGIGVSSIGGGILSAITGSQAWLFIMTAAVPVLSLIGKLIDLNSKKQEKQNIKTAIGSALTAVGSAFKENLWIGIAMAALVTTALAAAGLSALATFKSGKKNAEQIQDLNKEIYDLTKRAEALETVVSKFDAIDEKVIKTNEDLKEMNDLLSSAADNLDDTEVDKKDDVGYGKGVSQKQAYEALSSNVERRRFLEDEAKQMQQEVAKKFVEARQQIEELRRKGKLGEFLNGSSEEARAVRDTVYNMNNYKMYGAIDSLVNEGAITSEEGSNIQT